MHGENFSLHPHSGPSPPPHLLIPYVWSGPTFWGWLQWGRNAGDPMMPIGPPVFSHCCFCRLPSCCWAADTYWSYSIPHICTLWWTMGSRTAFWAPETDLHWVWGLLADLPHSRPNLAQHQHSIIVLCHHRRASCYLPLHCHYRAVFSSCWRAFSVVPNYNFKVSIIFFTAYCFSNSIEDISNPFYRHLQSPPSTWHLSSFPMPIRPLPTISNLLPNSHCSLMLPWVLSMAPTSIAPCLPKSAACQGTAKVFSHRTASLHVPLTSVSPTHCLDGRGQLLILPFTTTHAKSTSLFLQGDTTLQTLVLPHATCFLSLTGTSSIICVNGNMATASVSWFLLTNLLLTLIIPPSPCMPEELFNLCHASACNVIEWIFRILKCQFQILYLPPEYDMSVQSHIPAALVALHNFIHHYNPEEIDMYCDPTAEFDLEVLEMAATTSVGELGTGPVSGAERNSANERWDRIMCDMWVQYLM